MEHEDMGMMRIFLIK
ncbi:MULTISPECIES: hypothetical protein [Flavobacteriaceae]|nr:hypothetical protein [Salinimicrobium tongyeongense]